MKSKFLVLLLSTLLSSSVLAGPFTDEMAKCLVRKTSDADKTLLMKWMYSAMSKHPDVKAMSNVSPAQSVAISKKTAAMVTTLLTKRCKSETAQALKYEGGSSFKASFAVLGQVAMKGLMTDPNVGGYLGGLGKYIDKEEFNRAFAKK